MSERTRFKSLLQLFTASWVSRVPFGDSVFLVCKMHITAPPPPRSGGGAWPLARAQHTVGGKDLML